MLWNVSDALLSLVLGRSPRLAIRSLSTGRDCGAAEVAPVQSHALTHRSFAPALRARSKALIRSASWDRREVGRTDPFCHYALAAAHECITDAKLDADHIERDRIGVIWSSGIGGLVTLEEQIGGYYRGDGTPRFSPLFIPKMISDMAAGLISIRYGFRGPNFCAVSACASSSHSIIEAFNYIRLGKADAIVAGGSEASIAPSAVGGFSAMKALSERNDSPETASRPFDRDPRRLRAWRGCRRTPAGRTRACPRAWSTHLRGNRRRWRNR